ncbi:uncharacterized protein DNG_05544 [Cephalotrichum gorgonifer]|uniref:SNF2 N-terminal domain-containing protein n=1 Tax=Cephalotrichum gorgonifer TaxID=2041049 RepID=A0AAE8SWC7_9PEZI|nr:uncharacterized protein DNG_05544 [Cephalotrichum gorgonifer]
MDEAHVAKNADGIFINFLRMIRFRAVHLVTVTPIVNGLKHILNLLEVLWTCMGLEAGFEKIPDPSNLPVVYSRDLALPVLPDLSSPIRDEWSVGMWDSDAEFEFVRP